jgi:hypothetical protein
MSQRLQSSTDSHLLLVLAFIVGISLPLVSLKEEKGLSGGTVERVILADIMVLASLGFSSLMGRLRLSTPSVLYFFALSFSLVFACLRAGGEVTSPLIDFSALVMAFLYLVFAYTVCDSRRGLQVLMLGLFLGVCWQGIIVLHDYFFPSQWFPDPMSGRVRGTFRANGQLAAYGFSLAGILLTLGGSLFESPRLRRWLLAAGLLAIFFVVAASRRSGLAGLVIWLILYLGFDMNKRWTAGHTVLLTLLLLMGVGASLHLDTLADSFLGQRVTSAVERVEDGDSFTQYQFETVMGNIEEWFPFGYGVGLGFTHTQVNKALEIHNGHLALLAELGLASLLAFYALVLRPLFEFSSSDPRCSRGPNPGAGANHRLRALAMGFLLAGAIFMIHNRLHRDRGFMLYLGMLSALAVQRSGTSATGVKERTPRHGCLCDHRAPV